MIHLAQARRSRVNGTLVPWGDGARLVADEAFTLCRMYMAPLLRNAETSFLASVSPEGSPDVAHRGGPPRFLKFDPAEESPEWTEYLGDGVFKSAGNIRASERFTLLVPDPESGHGVELIGRGAYVNIRGGGAAVAAAEVPRRSSEHPEGLVPGFTSWGWAPIRFSLWPLPRTPAIAPLPPPLFP